MCIGIPMKVSATRAGHACVAGRGEVREVDTALVGEVRPGDWLLVFLDSARERIGAARAAEVDATLDLLQAALQGAPLAEPAFDLPSAMSADRLALLAGRAGPSTPSAEPCR
jgi:hydrogenase expression/formation protein HypC